MMFPLTYLVLFARQAFSKLKDIALVLQAKNSQSSQLQKCVTSKYMLKLPLIAMKILGNQFLSWCYLCHVL